MQTVHGKRKGKPMKMAIVVNRNEKTISIVEKKWTLEEMQEVVGGYIESVRVLHPREIFVNEEGAIMNPPLPPWSLLGEYIFRGNAIIFDGVDNEGDTIGFKLQSADYLCCSLRKAITWIEEPEE